MAKSALYVMKIEKNADKIQKSQCEKELKKVWHNLKKCEICDRNFTLNQYD